MARTRHVFPSTQVCHLWAHQTQSDARNAGGNLSFDGDKLVSYGHYTIGRIMERKRKGKIVLIQSSKYSVTTAKQIREAESATSHMTRVHVPNLVDSSYVSGTSERVLDHSRNLSHFRRGIETTNELIDRSRHHTKWYFKQLDEWISEANTYSKFFSLKVKFKSKYSDTVRIEMENAANVRAEAAYAKREAQFKVAREKSEAEYRRRQAERIPEATKLMSEWIDGAGSLSYAIADASRVLNRTALRIVGENVQTSMGAEFPVSHARLGLALVRRTIAQGVEWRTNGHTLHLGHFKIDSISADGTVKAGCHVVTFPEIERIAPMLDAASETQNFNPVVTE